MKCRNIMSKACLKILPCDTIFLWLCVLYAHREERDADIRNDT